MKMIAKSIKYIVVVAFVITLLSPDIMAQSKSDSIRTIVNHIEESGVLRQNLWLETTNASGLGVDSIPDYGHLVFKGDYIDADYRATFTPENKLAYGMKAYGFKSLDKIFLKGSFSYFRSDEDGVEWTSMMDPLQNCPFVIADSIGGDWKKDYYKLHMLAGTVPVFGVFRFGVGIDYNVSTGGRDNDPRPKSIVKQLSIRPALSFVMNKSHLGFSYLYDDYRQDLDVMNKYGVGGSMVYKIMGLSLMEKPIMKSSIEYRIDRWNNGMALQYGHAGTKFNYVLEAKYRYLMDKGVMYPYRSYEDIENRILYSIPEEDYKAGQNEYTFYSAANYKGNINMHYIKFQYKTKDGSLYNLSTDQVEVKNNNTNAEIRYEFYNNYNDADKIGKYLLGIEYKKNELENLYYATQTVEKLTYTGTIDKHLNFAGSEFSLSVMAKYVQDLDSELNIDPESDFFQKETDITNPYVVNNFAFASSDYIQGSFGITYYGMFNKRTNYFIGCKAERLQVLESILFEDHGITSVSFKVGVLF